MEWIKKANTKEKYVSKYWTLAFLLKVIENFEKLPFYPREIPENFWLS